MNKSLLLLSSNLWRPTREEIRAFKGSFCIPDAFNYIPYGDNRRIWTPDSLIYDDFWLNKIIEVYKSYRYTHYVMNLGGHSYHNDYFTIPSNPLVARNFIIKLLKNHIIPVCCATDDAYPDQVLKSYEYNADLIDCSFVMWEMNQACEGDSDRMFEITKKVRDANPKALTYLHFTAGHGSMGIPEGEWWKKCAAIGIVGQLEQEAGFYDDNDTGDPVKVAQGIENTAQHLHGQVPGWEGLDLDCIAFENTTTPVYHKWKGWDGIKQRAYGDYIINHCPSIAGWCDGANVEGTK